MKGWKFLTILLLFFVPSIVKAQFYITGDDRATTKWYSVETPTYKVIYPRGADSLARVYAASLEKYSVAVGRSAGCVPGEYTREKIPVIMHGYNASSNGVVVWAPKRMDLFTSPQAYSSEAMPWVDMLTLHEQRHIAQMQTGLSGIYRGFDYVFGEMFNGLVAGIFQSSYILEGDAVIAETAFSNSGRGRTGNFLNYYMIAFDNGDFRTWTKWKLGSHKHYAPNEYALGYMTIGGLRYIYGVDDFPGKYFRYIAEKRPYDFNGWSNTLKRTVGKRTAAVFNEVRDTMHRMWSEEIQARAPFIPYNSLSPIPKIYTQYQKSAIADDGIYSVRSGMTRAAALVRTDADGSEHIVRAFAAASGKFCVLPEKGRIYWSEYGYDTRWEMDTKSIIRYYDLNKHTTKTINKNARLFNPSAPEDESAICVTEYFPNGRTGLTIIDPDNGSVIATKTAPDSLQVCESAWLGDSVYFSAISSNGYGIYSVPFAGGKFGESVQEVLSPQPVMLTELRATGDELIFASDRSGVNELYHFDPATGSLRQKTSTRYGAEDFAYNYDGDTLYYSLKLYEGDLIVKTPVDSLLNRSVEFGDRHVYRLAEFLSEQEAEGRKAIAESAADSVEISAPKRYYKGGHIFKVHSWAPVYFNIDNIMSFSYDHFYEMLSLGAAAISQNQLGSAIMQFGYSAHKNPYDKSHWKHSGHFSITYTGWYPVIEASVDFNDRPALDYYYMMQDYGSIRIFQSGARTNSSPFVDANFKIYIPFNFSRGGWSSGFVPQLSYEITNDVLSKWYLKSVDGSPTGSGIYTSKDKNILLQSLTFSARGYAMRPVPDSGIFPRWGIGAQAGVRFRPWFTDYYSPSTYLYVYGYVPGISLTHGIKLTWTGQESLSDKAVFNDAVVNTLPRGLSSNSRLEDYFSMYSKGSMKATFDYTFPIYIGDVTIAGQLFSIKRFIITPHFDYSAFNWTRSSINGNLYSVGGTFSIDFSSFFWMGFPFEIGVTYSYNAGSAFRSLNNAMISSGYSPLGRHYVGPVFSVTFN